MTLIHIKELFRLQDIGNLRLIAGQDGLERTVTEAVLFEYDPSRVQLPDFYRGDLVVTTLAYARGDAQLVTQSLLSLMRQGIAGLMVKTAYFTELPKAVLAMADQTRTPVLLFDHTYIEEVILQVTDLIRGKRHFAGFERELDALMRGSLTREQTLTHLQRLDPLGFNTHRVYALLPLGRLPGMEDALYDLLCRDAQAAHRYIFMTWKQMILALRRIEPGESTDDPCGEMDALLQSAGIDRGALAVGISGDTPDRLAVGTALREAIYAARAAKLCERSAMTAAELGMYGYLFPMSEDPFICQQCRRAMALIRDYDAQNHTNLEHTANVYVAQNLEVAAAAKMLYQHPNTVRYRLGKIQKIMQLEGNAFFEPMLCLTINLSRILEESGHP